MEYLEKYESLDRTIELMKFQVVDSLEFANQVCPKVSTPKELWDWLKPKLHFKDDEAGYEDLQSMQTLFLKKGMGDCDCFVITTLACLIVNNFQNIAICLAGYDKRGATHIYSQVEFNGSRVVLDFTNPNFNQERNSGPKGKYKYRQIVSVRWENWM